MSKFIWVRDRDRREHYLNVDHIMRVSKIPATGQFLAHSYIMLRDGKDISLSLDTFDTYEDVIAKIQAAA